MDFLNLFIRVLIGIMIIFGFILLLKPLLTIGILALILVILFKVIDKFDE